MIDLFAVGTVLLGAASLGLSTAKGIRDDKEHKKLLTEESKKAVSEMLSHRERFRKLGK